MHKEQAETPLSRGLGRLVCTLAASEEMTRDGAGLPDVVLREWGQFAVDGIAGTLSIRRSALHVELPPEESVIRNAFGREAAGRATLTAAVPDRDLVLTLEQPLLVGTLGGSKSAIAAAAYAWSLLPRTNPSLWFGRLDGVLNVQPWRNLRAADRFGRFDLFVRTRACDLVVVHRDNRRDHEIVIIDTHGVGAPDRRTVHRLLRLLGFLIPARLRVDFLRGASEDGDPLDAYLGVAVMAEKLDRPFADSPVSHSKCWLAPAFERLAEAALREGSLVPLACEYYLSSFEDIDHEAYLKLVVAIEGLALEVLRTHGEQAGVVTTAARTKEDDEALLIVRDDAEWRAVRERLRKSPEFAAYQRLVDAELGVAEGAVENRMRAEALVSDRRWAGALKSSVLPRWKEAGHLGAGRRVEAAFWSLGLMFDARMREVERAWHDARHTAVARTSGDALASDVAVLRTMLLALLFGWCGYRGEFIGHGRYANGVYATAEIEGWNTAPEAVDANALASARYVALP